MMNKPQNKKSAPRVMLGALSDRCDKVVVGGKSTAEMPLKDMSRMVGTLFQDPEQQRFSKEIMFGEPVIRGGKIRRDQRDIIDLV